MLGLLIREFPPYISAYHKYPTIFSYGKKKQLAGLVYLYPISTARVKGCAMSDSKKTLEALCGKDASKHIVFATTMWAALAGNDDLGSQREEQLATEIWKGVTAHRTYRLDRRTRECAQRLIDFVLSTRDDPKAVDRVAEGDQRYPSLCKLFRRNKVSMIA